MSDDGFLSVSDAFALGGKIVEMADKVKPMHGIMPGAEAVSHFSMDGVRFRVAVSVAREQDETEPGAP